MMRCTALLFCLFPIAATAQEMDCANAVTQADMNLCSYQSWQDADATLNEVYAEAVAMMQQFDTDYPSEDDAGEEARLRKAQRAWVAFRDANCDVAGYTARGGSMEPMLVSDCLYVVTEARTAELQTLLQDY